VSVMLPPRMDLKKHSKTIVQESEFYERITKRLKPFKDYFKCVTGPGRSGSICAVYASYFLNIPFIPLFGSFPEKMWPVLIIDTAFHSGRTLRKAKKKIKAKSHCIALWHEPPIVHFWYEQLTPRPTKRGEA
jgi:hypothetical protein